MGLRNSPWPERDEELLRRWDAGEKTAQIARNMHLTKNQVVGRAGRLGRHRESPIKPLPPGQDYAPRKGRRIYSPPKLADIVSLASEAISPAPAPSPVIRALRPSEQCAWPTGKIGHGKYVFCEEPVQTDERGRRRPYCQKHSDMAYGLKKEGHRDTAAIAAE